MKQVMGWLAVLFLLASCTSEGSFEDPIKQRKLVKSITTDGFQWLYEYDSENRMVKLTGLANNTIGYSQENEFADGKLVRSTWSDDDAFGFTEYIYSGERLLEVVKFVQSGSYSNTEKHTNIVEKDGRYVSYDVYHNDTLYEAINSIYENGNLTKRERFRFDSQDQKTLWATDTYTYDDKRNPFQFTYAQTFSSVWFYSKNNLIEHVLENESFEVEYSYSYEYKGGRPTKSSNVERYQGDIRQSETIYEYE